MSCVTCHVSHFTCHMLHFFFFLTMWWSLSVEGLLSTEPWSGSLQWTECSGWRAEFLMVRSSSILLSQAFFVFLDKLKRLAENYSSNPLTCLWRQRTPGSAGWMITLQWEIMLFSQNIAFIGDCQMRTGFRCPPTPFIHKMWIKRRFIFILNP